MFSLGAKLNTNLLKRDNRDNAGLSSRDKSDENQTSIERLYNKYTDQYNSRALADSEQLAELLKSEMKSAIMLAWQQNTELNGSIAELEQKLDEAIKLHLEEPADELEKTKDVTEHGSKIISAMHAIRRFHNTLLANVYDSITGPVRDELKRAENNKAEREAELNDIKKTYSDIEKEKELAEIDRNTKSMAAAEDPTNPERKRRSNEAKDKLKEMQKKLEEPKEELEDKQTDFENANNEYKEVSIKFDAAKRAEERSIRDVTRIVRERIIALITSRMNSVKEYETAIKFIGETSKN
jgi:hypothetical protein